MIVVAIRYFDISLAKLQLLQYKRLLLMKCSLNVDEYIYIYRMIWTKHQQSNAVVPVSF